LAGLRLGVSDRRDLFVTQNQLRCFVLQDCKWRVMVGPGGPLRSESEVMSLERPEDPLYIVEQSASFLERGDTQRR